ncbi:MAG: hypothetical protein M1300_05715 [Epsilonproteobacteria bacterium]|nr:hypothetical protein [Campylobacterota bacterium]
MFKKNMEDQMIPGTTIKVSDGMLYLMVGAALGLASGAIYGFMYGVFVSTNIMSLFGL